MFVGQASCLLLDSRDGLCHVIESPLLRDSLQARLPTETVLPDTAPTRPRSSVSNTNRWISFSRVFGSKNNRLALGIGVEAGFKVFLAIILNQFSFGGANFLPRTGRWYDSLARHQFSGSCHPPPSGQWVRCGVQCGSTGTRCCCYLS